MNDTQVPVDRCGHCCSGQSSSPAPPLCGLSAAPPLLKQELERSTSAHERFLVSPQNAGYSGGPRRFGWVKGSGVLALTDRRVIFRRVFGGLLEIELADIASVSEAAWYRGMYKAGRRHVILHLKEGAKVAFMVRDASPWLEAFDKALTKG